MATCVVSGVIKDVSDTAISGAEISSSLVTPVFSGTTFIAPKEVSTTSAVDGTWSLTLVQGVSVIIHIEYPPSSTDTKRRVSYAITVPASSSANFSTLATEL